MVFTLKTEVFCKLNIACQPGVEWAKSNGYHTMALVWDKLIEHKKIDWLHWVASRPNVLSSLCRRQVLIQMIYRTPVGTSNVAQQLTEPRSLAALEVAKSICANGLDTPKSLDDLRAAWAGAVAAAQAVRTQEVTAENLVKVAVHTAVEALARQDSAFGLYDGGLWCLGAACFNSGPDETSAEEAHVKIYSELANPF